MDMTGVPSSEQAPPQTKKITYKFKLMTKTLLLMALWLTATVFAGNATAQTGTDGGLTTILDEKFDAFTEGSEDEPATTDISSFSSGKLGSTLTGWSGRKIYEAGGMLKVDNGGQLQTARYDLSANGGIVKITMKVKSLAYYGTAIDCRIGYNTSEQILLDGAEWHTVSLVMEKGTSSAYVRIAPYSILEGFLIDELKIETGPNLIKAPEAKQPSVANGTSFNASWSKVSNAKDYLLDVYTKTANGTKEYLTQDQAVTGTSATVDGLTANTTYYYTVRARKDNGAVSDYSNEIEVVKVITELAAPVATEPTNLSQEGFTANWEAVADATSYIVTLKKTETLATAREAEVLSEGFDKVNLGTLSSIEYGKTEEYIDAYTTLPGWYAISHAFAKGHLVLSPFGETAASLTTPSLDLSAAQGAFKLHLNLSEQAFGTVYEGGEVTVNVFKGKDEVEKQTFTVAKGFSDYTLDFTKGSDDTYVQISYGGSRKVFIDSISISQELAAGDQLTTLQEKKESEDTHADFTVNLDDDNSIYTYTVQAEGRTVEGGEIVSIVSEASNAISFSLPTTGIFQTGSQEGFSAFTQGGSLVVTLPTAANVRIFAADGRLVKTLTGQAGNNYVTLSSGLYIIEANGQTAKVVL